MIPVDALCAPKVEFTKKGVIIGNSAPSATVPVANNTEVVPSEIET